MILFYKIINGKLDFPVYYTQKCVSASRVYNPSDRVIRNSNNVFFSVICKPVALGERGATLLIDCMPSTLST